MKDFILNVCSHRGIDPDTATCIEFSHQELGNSFLTIYDSGDAWLDRMRSVAATRFMEREWANYLIFLDDDICFEPRDLKKIYEDLTLGYELVGGAYPVRNGTQLASRGFGELGAIHLNGNIQEVQFLATGFMGIAKTLLKRMQVQLDLPRMHIGEWCESYPFFVFDYGLNERTGEKMLFSEDWDFCEKARKAGAKVYLDTSVQVAHVGRRLWSVRDVLIASIKRQAERERQEKGRMDVELAEEALWKTCQVLGKYTPNYWIDSGTLLHAVREGGINKYDHDIDVRCLKEDIPDEKMPDLVADLYKIGYMTVQQNAGDRKQLLGLYQSKIMLDLKFCESNKEYLWQYVWDSSPGSSIDEKSEVVAHVFPIEFFRKFEKVKLGSHEYQSPSPVIDYLTYHYGEQWKEFKSKPEDVDETDMTWDAQHTPPCSKSLKELAELTAVTPKEK